MVRSPEQYLSSMDFDLSTPDEARKRLNSGERAFVEKYLGLEALEKMPELNPEPFFKPFPVLPDSKKTITTPEQKSTSQKIEIPRPNREPITKTLEIAPARPSEPKQPVSSSVIEKIPQPVVPRLEIARQDNAEHKIVSTAKIETGTEQAKDIPEKVIAHVKAEVVQNIPAKTSEVVTSNELNTSLSAPQTTFEEKIAQTIDDKTVDKSEGIVPEKAKADISSATSSAADEEIASITTPAPVLAQVAEEIKQEITTPAVQSETQLVESNEALATEVEIIQETVQKTVSPVRDEVKDIIKTDIREDLESKSDIQLAQEVSIREKLKQEEEILMVSFFVSGQLFLLPVAVIQEVLRHMELVKVPQAPSFVAGAINLRGRVTPIVYLATLLTNTREYTYSEKNFIIVCGSETLQLGLVIDKINSMHMLPQNKIIWNAESKLGEAAEFLCGIADLDDRVCGIVAPDIITQKLLAPHMGMALY